MALDPLELTRPLPASATYCNPLPTAKRFVLVEARYEGHCFDR